MHHDVGAGETREQSCEFLSRPIEQVEAVTIPEVV